VAAAVSSSSTAFVWGLKPATLSETARVVSEWVTVQDVASLVTDYMFTPERFGAVEWLHWFGVDVGQEPKFPKEITLFWNQLDPMDSINLVSTTHLPPVLCPEFIDGKPFTLRLLGEIVQHPKNGGHASKYSDLSPTLTRHQDTPAGPACWLVMRKGVVARNKPYAEQVAWIQSLPVSYEATTSTIHLVTVVFTRHVIARERYLGDRNGQEQCCSLGRCQEFYHHNANLCRSAVGNFTPNGLSISISIDDSKSYGVVALRKF